MRRQRITNRGEFINLGHKGENNATVIEFNIPDDWQNGVVQLFVKRATDKEPYVPGDFYIEDGIAYWNVSSADTAVVGHGFAQYCAIFDGMITKSTAFITITEKSIDVLDISVDEPEKSTLEAALEAVSEFSARAQEAANTAEYTAQQVYSAVNDAKEYSAEAKAAKDTASSYATDASVSKTSAENAAQTATTKAAETVASAGAAAVSASQAEGSASSASASAVTAREAGATAVTKATEAAASASVALNAQTRAEAAASKAEAALYEWFTLEVDESTGRLLVTERIR